MRSHAQAPLCGRVIHWLWYTLPLLYIPGIERLLGGPRPGRCGPVHARRPLAVAAHPDDLEYFCGGTLHRLASEGAHITAVVATRGEVGGDPVVRRREAETAMRLLGVQRLHLLDFPDRRVRKQLPDLRQGLRTILAEAAPDLLLTFDTAYPYPVYHHADHMAVAQAALQVWQGPALLFHTRRPTTAVDITDHLQAKAAAFSTHASQLPRRAASRLVGWHLHRRHRGEDQRYVELFRESHSDAARGAP